ncbi:MAG TPA: hemolysin family protein [Spirochaetia bacterium]|nr:HlyC/CorC family transporter [Spirochaetaceae bacterium]HPE88702.1 hemolysin family protein [Spirochaetales bacterium]HRW24097.1 hemolysin family protein [Spirochaetia bacterium]
MSASLLGVAFCLVFSALFSSVETAFTSLSLFQIESLKKRGRGGAIVERLARKPDELISTILIGNNVVNITASALATRWALGLWGDWALGLVTGAMTLVVLIFGEVTPKRIALAHNEGVALALAPLLLVCTVLFKPFVLLVNALSSLVTRLFGDSRPDSLSMDTMVQMMSIAEHMGVIDYAKSRMVKNVFRLGSTTVQAVMTHRIDVFSLEDSTSLEDACRLASEAAVSRVPVYVGESENIVGVVSVREAVAALLAGNGQRPLSEFMGEPLFVLPNKTVGDLFALFKKRRETFAVVIDEYGGLAGIVTMRDIVEEIVGEIYEDSDEASRERIERRQDGSYLVSGDAPLSVIAEIAGGEPPNLPYVQTVAGYVAWALDRIAVPGDKAETPLGGFIVTAVDANRVSAAVFRPAGKD